MWTTHFPRSAFGPVEGRTLLGLAEVRVFRMAAPQLLTRVKRTELKGMRARRRLLHRMIGWLVCWLVGWAGHDHYKVIIADWNSILVQFHFQRYIISFLQTYLDPSLSMKKKKMQSFEMNDDDSSLCHLQCPCCVFFVFCVDHLHAHMCWVSWGSWFTFVNTKRHSVKPTGAGSHGHMVK